MSTPIASPKSAEVALDAGIRAVLARLAVLDRGSGGAGARAAAELIGLQLEQRGASVSLQEESVHGTYWVPIGVACAFAAACAMWRRGLAVAGGALAAICAADELEIGIRPLRHVLRRRTAVNALAEVAPQGPAEHTLVVHAHHDAAHTGLVFHPAIAKTAARLGGRLIERIGGTPAPMWGAAAGVAVLLALAEALAEASPRRLRVLLLSTGSEESFLEGMEAFAARHFAELPQTSTTFLCIESVGSPELMLLSGEGLLRLRRYPPGLVDRLAGLARRRSIPLHDPFRYRLATDGQVPLRAGYQSAVISSIDSYKAPSNYHWPSDRPENLCFATVGRAAALAAAFIEDLDRGAEPAPGQHRGDSPPPPDRDR